VALSASSGDASTGRPCRVRRELDGSGVPCSHITQITTGCPRPIAAISMIVVDIFSAVKMRSIRTHFYRDRE
jgi:hypothetical protein